MLKKFLLLCFMIVALGMVPSLAETIGPVQQGNLVTVNFTLPDELQGAVYLFMYLDYPRDAFMLVPTDSVPGCECQRIFEPRVNEYVSQFC